MSLSKKLVSVVVPVYNEEQMIVEVYDRVNKVFKNSDKYSYELVFFDDGSTDGTREAIEKLSEKYPNVKAVFYAKNFGYMKNTFYAMQQAKGDCAFLLHADLQNPPELIPAFLEKWGNGAKVVLGIKNKSKENAFVYFLRTIFYFLMIHFFGVNIIAHCTEFELFDKDFINVLRNVRTNNPFLRGIVSEYAFKKDYIYYTQDSREKGKSKFNLNKYYDFALCGITQYSKKLPRRIIGACAIGFVLVLIEMLFIFLPSVKNIPIYEISSHFILRILIVCLLALIVLVSILFEYVIQIADNSNKKPFIIEEKRINY